MLLICSVLDFFFCVLHCIFYDFLRGIFSTLVTKAQLEVDKLIWYSQYQVDYIV